MSKDKKHEKVLIIAENIGTPGQSLEFGAKVNQAIAANWDIVGPRAQYFIQSENFGDLKYRVRQVFAGQQRNEQDAELIQLQQKFYREVFGKIIDFTHTFLPAPVDDLTFPFGIAEGMYDPLVWPKVKEALGLYTEPSIKPTAISDQNLKNMISDRQPYKNYFIRLEYSVEPKPALKNLSWNVLRERKIHTQAFHEHGLFTLFAWWWKKEHLDVSNVTICGASRLPDGRFPCVRWSGVRVHFYWHCPDRAYDDWRGRAVVS